MTASFEYIALILLTTVVVYAVDRLVSLKLSWRRLAWAPSICAAVLSTWISIDLPAAARMVMIIMATLIALKSVALTRSTTRLRFDRWIVFVWFWPGMQTKPFRGTVYRPVAGAWLLIRHGISFVALGATFIVASRLVWSATASVWTAGPLCLVGISLCLHFGFLNIVAGSLRTIGINVTPLFLAPLKSRSLREFWSQRWNLAFNDMTSRWVFVPVARKYNTDVALFVAFAYSGLLHELAISVPVNAGYGLPMIYFLLQAIGTRLERTLEQHGHKLSTTVGRIWSIAWVVIPMPLVFHSAFLNAIVWPIFKN